MTAAELIEFRKLRYWSQSRLAFELGCSARAIAKWEKGETKIPGSIALAVSAVAMNLPPYGK